MAARSNKTVPRIILQGFFKVQPTPCAACVAIAVVNVIGVQDAGILNEPVVLVGVVIAVVSLRLLIAFNA